MSQITVDVQLKEIDEKDVLVFILDKENPEKYIVNLNSATSQLELKEVFGKITGISNERRCCFAIIYRGWVF